MMAPYFSARSHNEGRVQMSPPMEKTQSPIGRIWPDGEDLVAQLGMLGQAQVIVRSEINDALAVEGALRRLFVLKYTQAKIGALGLEIIQLFGEIRKRIGSSSSGHEALRAEISLNDRSRPSP